MNHGRIFLAITALFITHCSHKPVGKISAVPNPDSAVVDTSAKEALLLEGTVDKSALAQKVATKPVKNHRHAKRHIAKEKPTDFAMAPAPIVQQPAVDVPVQDPIPPKTEAVEPEEANPAMGGFIANHWIWGLSLFGIAAIYAFIARKRNAA